MVDGVFDDHAVMARLARFLDDVLGATPVLEARVDDERVFDAEVQRDHAGFRVLVVPRAVGVGVRLGGARVVGGEEDVAAHRASLEAAREDAPDVGGTVVHDARLAGDVDDLRVAEPPAERRRAGDVGVRPRRWEPHDLVGVGALQLVLGGLVPRPRRAVDALGAAQVDVARVGPVLLRPLLRERLAAPSGGGFVLLLQVHEAVVGPQLDLHRVGFGEGFAVFGAALTHSDETVRSAHVAASRPVVSECVERVDRGVHGPTVSRERAGDEGRVGGQAGHSSSDPSSSSSSSVAKLCFM